MRYLLIILLSLLTVEGAHPLTRRLASENEQTQWLLRDEFSDTRAAGQVNGTFAYPGPGTRTVTDGSNTVSLLSATSFTALGDSKTVAAQTNWFTALAGFHNTITNCSGSGWTIANITQNLATVYGQETKTPKLILVNIGVNGVGTVTENTWTNNMVYTLDYLQTKWPGSFVYWAHVMRSNYEATCTNMNTWSDAIIATRTNVFVGIAEEEFIGDADYATYTTDGTHYNLAGMYEAARRWLLLLTKYNDLPNDFYVSRGTSIVKYPSITRANGKTIILKREYSINDTSSSGLRIDNAASAYMSCISPLADNNFYVYSPNPTVRVAYAPLARTYNLAITLRAVGAYYLIQSTGKFELVWADTAVSTAELYPAIYSLNSMSRCYWIRSPNVNLPINPILSDSFTRANGAIGTTDGNGHREKDGSGGGTAWSGATWGINSNTATNNPSTTSDQIALLSCSTPNVIADTSVNYTTGTENHAGLILGYVDADNYCRAYLTNNRVRLDTVISGNATNIIDGALTYVAGSVLRCVFVPATPEARLFYNNAAIGSVSTTATLTNYQSAIKVGLYATSNADSFTNTIVWARGSENQYNVLNRYTK